MEQATQWGVSIPNTFPMKKYLKSKNPALNIPRRHEPVATDTVFSETPAVDSGVKQAQLFVGRDTLVADASPMKSGKQFVNTLEDIIRRRGDMDKLLSDSGGGCGSGCGCGGGCGGGCGCGCGSGCGCGCGGGVVASASASLCNGAMSTCAITRCDHHCDHHCDHPLSIGCHGMIVRAM